MKRIESSILFKYKYSIALLIFTVVIGFVGESSIINRIEQKKDISDLEKKIQKQKDLFWENSDQLNCLKNDVNAVKRIAREKYYMKTCDEEVFVIEDEE